MEARKTSTRSKSDNYTSEINTLQFLLVNINDSLNNIRAAKHHSLSEIKQLYKERHLLTQRLIDCMMKEYGNTEQVFYLADGSRLLRVLRGYRYSFRA